ncbi:hypothetical protein LTR17_005914 [Elasticomyces elasticus]|nr:hypothetical protein LTR17_005914 [Elasticomyces elasticus]
MDETKESSISGLRELIKGTRDLSQLRMLTDRRNPANAVLLFPSLVAKHQKANLTKPSVHTPSTGAFDIVVTIMDEHSWVAYLTYTTDHGAIQVAWSHGASSLVEALQSLLEVTARALGVQYSNCEVFNGSSLTPDDEDHDPEWKEYGNGEIDQGLVGYVKWV